MGAGASTGDMTSLHVSEDLRGHGAGRQLFLLAKDWARDHGAEKLYISSHSAVETQRFYESMGCVDAEEVMEEHEGRSPTTGSWNVRRMGREKQTVSCWP